MSPLRQRGGAALLEVVAGDEVAFEVDHERVAEEPEVIEVGEAESESIGAGVGGGGVPLVSSL